MNNQDESTRPLSLSWLAGNLCRMLMQWLDLIFVSLWHPRLLLASLHFVLFSLGRSPYRVQGFEQKLLRGRFTFLQDDDVYGETPWWTLKRMLVFLQAKPGECFVDLGSGSGRALYGALVLFDMRGQGYEFLQSRHALATHLLHRELHNKRVQLYQELAWKADLSQADIILLTWTCMAPQSRAKISQTLQKTKPGTRIITVTHPLEINNDFELLQHSRRCFSWGRGEVYFYQKKSNPQTEIDLANDQTSKN